MLFAKLLPAMLAGSAAAQVRFMPFGDSITEITCWRSLLWERLRTTEFSTAQWVGSGRNENACGDNAYDRDNEGHSGFLAVNIANQNQLVNWLRTNPADVITMHLGTNDIVQQGLPTTQIIAAFTTLVSQMRQSNPRMKIVVAQIIPLGIGTYNTQVQALNAAILPWARQQNQTQSPIWVVDQYTGYSGTADNRDGIHPNLSGDTKMTNKWYPAVLAAFRAAQADRANVNVAVPFIA